MAYTTIGFATNGIIRLMNYAEGGVIGTSLKALSDEQIELPDFTKLKNTWRDTAPDPANQYDKRLRKFSNRDLAKGDILKCIKGQYKDKCGVIVGAGCDTVCLKLETGEYLNNIIPAHGWKVYWPKRLKKKKS